MIRTTNVFRMRVLGYPREIIKQFPFKQAVRYNFYETCSNQTLFGHIFLMISRIDPKKLNSSDHLKNIRKCEVLTQAYVRYPLLDSHCTHYIANCT